MYYGEDKELLIFSSNEVFLGDENNHLVLGVWLRYSINRAILGVQLKGVFSKDILEKCPRYA